MTAEPGWYYAEGDPPNTLRRWNGEQWIGFPIEDPATAEVRNNHVGVKPFQPVAGQVPLEMLSVAVTASFLLLMAGHGYLAFTVWQNSQYDAEAALDTLQVAPTPITSAVTVFAVLFSFAVVAFVSWFATAYRNLSRWHRTRRAPGWAAIVFAVPLIQFRWPWDMMLELVEKSARTEQQGKISPFAVLGWWVGWTFHISLFMGSLGLKRFTTLTMSSHHLAMGASVVAIVGMSFGLYLIHKLTAAQESRRRPTRAQRELALETAR